MKQLIHEKTNAFKRTQQVIFKGQKIVTCHVARKSDLEHVRQEVNNNTLVSSQSLELHETS